MTMTSEALDDDDWYEPQRDRRGRFRRGSTGNPNGRPRKQARSWSVAAALAEALAEEVPVRVAGGAEQSIQLRDFLIKTLVRSGAKAKPRDLIFLLEWLNKYEAFTHLEQEEDEARRDEWRRKGERLLAQVEREFPQLREQYTINSQGND